MAILNILVPVRIRLCVAKMMAGVFSVSALNQIHRVNVSSSENPVQTSDLASRVKLRLVASDGFILILKSGVVWLKNLPGKFSGSSITIHYKFK